MKRKYDWAELREKIAKAIRQNLIPDITYQSVAEYFGIPVSTIHDNIDLNSLTGERTTVENQTSLSAATQFPTSIEELAELFEVNLAQHIVKTFSVAIRELQDGGAVYSTRATLIPREIPDFIIRPVELVIPPPATKSLPELDGIVQTLVIPDMHFGFNGEETYHDEQYVEGILRLIQHNHFQNVVVLGDLLDMAEFTDFFVKDPDVARTSQRMIEAAAGFLASIRVVQPDCQIFYLEGNHEKRLERLINKNVPAIAGLRSAFGDPVLTIPNLLGLNKIGVKYIDGYPDNFVTIDGVTYVHGDVTGENSAAKMLAKYGRSVVYGHTHRGEYYEDSVYSDLFDGIKPIFAYSPGCGCKIGADLPGAKAINSWRMGAGIVSTAPKTWGWVKDIPYRNGRFLI